MTWLLYPLVAAADTCAIYGDPERITVADAPVEESSGLAASRARPRVLYTHDDAGGDPLIYAIDADGRYLGSHVVRGAGLVDWEDLAAGPCPRDGADCLYVGDIGDNEASRESIVVYVIEEPEEGGDARTVETWEATYPDGPHDAETLLVHPCTGDVYVVTKEDGATGSVYRFPRERGGRSALVHVADLALDDDQPITGGAWDADGDRLALRTRERIFEWATRPDEPDRPWDLPPDEITRLDEDQGEAVTYGDDGALVTTDEGLPLELHVVACLEVAPAVDTCAFTPTGGCGCATADGSPTWLALLALAFTRRRTRTSESPCRTAPGSSRSRS